MGLFMFYLEDPLQGHLGLPQEFDSIVSLFPLDARV